MEYGMSVIKTCSPNIYVQLRIDLSPGDSATHLDKPSQQQYIVFTLNGSIHRAPKCFTTVLQYSNTTRFVHTMIDPKHTRG